MILYITHQQNVSKIENARAAWMNKLNVPFVIVIGDHNISTSYVYNPTNKVLIVKCPDSYEYHTVKLVQAYQFILDNDLFKDTPGTIKLEDDVLVDVEKLDEYLSQEKKDYEGWRYVMDKPILNGKHRDKVRDVNLRNLMMVLEPQAYCLGSVFWLSRTAMEHVVAYFKKQPYCFYSWHLFEDYAIGKILKAANIEATDGKLFTENLTYFMNEAKHFAFHDKFNRYDLLQLGKKINP
jgi:hypothetical protein